MALISVVVPVYKVEKYIHRCVDSIIAQSFSDFDIVLVDDGSPDNCGKICDEYALKDNRIHVIHKENGGLSDARNAGIDWAFENSNSEWLTFIDSDDWIHSKYLEALYNAVKKSGCEISICGFEETEGNNPNVDEERLQPIMVYTEEFFCEKNVNAIVAWGKLYKKELFREICYPVGKLHEDEFTTYKLIFMYERLSFVDQPLYFYFINPEGITKREWNPRRLDVMEALENQIEFFKMHGFNDAFLYSLRSIVSNTTHQYLTVSSLNKKTKYLGFFKKKMRKYLKICQKHKLYSFSKSRYYYDIAYPNIMKFYWHFQAAKKRLKKEK